MNNRYLNWLLVIITLFSNISVAGQATMPDYVSTGQTRQYFIDPVPGSSCTWWINGVVQAGFTTNEFIYTWNVANTYLLEVQVLSAEGCPGPVRAGLVYVTPPQEKSLILYKAFSPNGDLINDVWIIGNTDLYPKMEVTIYNRWGQSVWKSETGYPVPWNGKSEGVELPVDSYHYIIDLHNGTRLIPGVITIVR